MPFVVYAVCADRDDINWFSIQDQEPIMSAPSRRPEIRRRRTRNEKIAKLKKRHAAASTEADRTRIAGKLHRLEFEFSRATSAQECLSWPA